jgi:hypothetical protein
MFESSFDPLNYSHINFLGTIDVNAMFTDFFAKRNKVVSRNHYNKANVISYATWLLWTKNADDPDRQLVKMLNGPLTSKRKHGS